ncbi:hypothetical protein JY718_17785 [Clostridioides difficile]|nr:hypothetical protein [Clostridioides difficile]
MDTMIIAKILNLKEANFKFLVKRYFDIALDKSIQGSNNWMEEEITEAHKEYCLNDSKYTFDLYKILYDEIFEKGLLEVLDQEIKTLLAMVELKINGIKLDLEGRNKEVRVLEAKTNEVANDEINLNSLKQIVDAFQNRNIPIKSTDDEVLEQFEDTYQEVKLLHKYCKLSKNINTFGYKIIEYLDKGGIIRPNWI